MSKKLSLDRLEGVCESQLSAVTAEWPDGIPLTKAAARRCAELGLDLDWAAQHLLTAPARAEYQRLKTTAWAEYEWLRVTAWAEYERLRATAWAEYQRAKATELLRLLKNGGAK